MEILTTAIVEGQTLNVGDTFDIGNGVSISINEIFSIDGHVYLANTTPNHPMMSFPFSEDGTDSIIPNRYLVHAGVWVRKNPQLFT